MKTTYYEQQFTTNRHIRHGLMLLWFTDLMNVTEEVTIHKPNVSTLLSSAFITDTYQQITQGDESSHNSISHKATTIRTLTQRAQLVCNTTDSLSDENKYLDHVFSKNNFNEDFIRRLEHSPTYHYYRS